MTQISGEVASGFEAVREAFERNFTEHGDEGAAFCLYRNGEKVVDLWGGVADVPASRPWTEDTLQLVFSTTKGATAICALRLVERGELDLDTPVTDLWPEFKAEGKEEIPVRWLLTHRSGLPALDGFASKEDVLGWDGICAQLAAQAPFWEPGTAHGYHALTYGWLVGEIVKRVSGKSLGTFFRDEVAGPLGLDFWVGLPSEQQERVSRLEQLSTTGMGDMDIDSLPPEVQEIARAFADPESLTSRALNITRPALNWNDPDVRAAEIPAANGVTTARSLAKLYAACAGEVDGVRVLKPETIETATQTQSEGPDKVLFAPTRFGLGFMLNSLFSPMLAEGSFGHAGAGGSLGFGDPGAGVGFGYVMNKMQQNLAGDPRTLGLIEAVKASL